MVALNNMSNDSLGPVPDFIVILGILCNLTQPLLYLSPIKCFIDMIKTGITEKIPFYYFVFNLINSLLWVILSVKHFDLPVLIANALCCVFFGIFLFGYLVTSNSKNLNSLFIRFNISCFSIILVAFMFWKVFSIQVIAVFAIAFETITYLSTLQYIREILELKDRTYINLFITTSILIVNSFWCLYAVLNKNWLVFTPNVVGLCVSSSLLILYRILPDQPLKVE